MLNKLFYKSLMILMIFISMNTLTFSKEVSITKDVSGFSSLLINSSGTVYLRQGNKDSVKIIIEKNLIPYLDVDNSSHELSLSVEKNRPEARSVREKDPRMMGKLWTKVRMRFIRPKKVLF